jgi:Flp pilus assembly protein TadG
MKRQLKCEKGQALIEFALTILFVMLFFVAFIELIMMFYTYNVLADSAKEGVRYAIVHGSKSGSPSTASTGSCSPVSTFPTSICIAVVNYARLSLHNPTAMTVTATYPDPAPANQPPKRVKVDVSYPYQPFFDLGWPTITVRASSYGRIMY